MDRSKTRNWRPATRAVRGGLMRSDWGETSEAMILTSGFAYDSAEEVEARFEGNAEGFTYTRQGNPTVAMFEERMALMDGSEIAIAMATGMAAMTATLLCQLKAGDHVVASRALFGSCRYLIDDLLPGYGIDTTVIDGRSNDCWSTAIRPNTKVFFMETPANPTLDIIDLRFVCALAKERGICTVVDNAFATPALQRPAEFGADVVAYSATKNIDGQGRVMGGVVCCNRQFHEELLFPFCRHTGATISPFNAWVLLKGLETLALRIDQADRNALEIANFMHDRVPELLYPGLVSFPQHALAMTQMKSGGTILSFYVSGKKQAFSLLNALELIDISNNLGDSRSLITHPATTTHKAVEESKRLELGITDGMLRISVGLEDPHDLIADLDQALKKAGL